MHDLTSFITPLIGITLILIFISRLFFSKPSKKVFMVDFSCYKPPISYVIPQNGIVNISRKHFNLKKEALDFMNKLIERNGIGNLTYFPRALLTDPLNVCLVEALNEVEVVIFGAVDELFAKTKVKCEDIGIVIVNCCVFNATPSLSSMIANRYKLKDSVKSYNLCGMGFTAGLIAISLANQLLQVHHNCYALVVSTKNLSQNCYTGNDLSKIHLNCAIRLGGAAILLSNFLYDRHKSKYQLSQTVTTNMAHSDQSYKCIFQEEDDEGKIGLTVTRNLLFAAKQAIESNILIFHPFIIPLSEKIIFFTNYITRCCHMAKIEPYFIDFRKSFDHFLPHVGAKPVFDELQRKLRLSNDEMEPSRMTLYRFGNTSSSTIWYELAYVEAKGKIKEGDRIWHMAFGSGFKCCSLFWRAIRTVDREEKNPWSDEVLELPVEPKNKTDTAFLFE